MAAAGGGDGEGEGGGVQDCSGVAAGHVLAGFIVGFLGEGVGGCVGGKGLVEGGLESCLGCW